MGMFQSVLYPLSRNEKRRTILESVSLLRTLGVESIHLLHVAEPGPDRIAWLQSIEKAITGACPCTVDHEIESGHVATVISSLAEEKKVDFIYMEGHRRSFLFTAFLGSTTRDVIRLTRIPAFVRRSRPELPPPGSDACLFASALVATDFGEAAQRAIPYVRQLARQGCRIHLLHVHQRAADPHTNARRFEKGERRLKELADDLRSEAPSVETHHITGNPAQVILRFAETQAADLIVIGRFNAPPGWNITGSTAERVVDQARSSLLLVP